MTATVTVSGTAQGLWKRVIGSKKQAPFWLTRKMGDAARATSMRAFRVEQGSTTFGLTNVDIPKIASNEVLISVKSAGLAPGMLGAASRGAIDRATTLGHEVAGVVEEVGAEVTNVKAGDRVRIHPTLFCGNCKNCVTGRDQACTQGAIIGFQSFSRGPAPLWEKYHDGGLADYVKAPSSLVDILPEHISFEVGAKVQELANAVRVLKVANLPAGASVAITAPTGAMGTACVKLAALFGIRRLILVGRNKERLEAVAKLSPVQVDVVTTSDAGEDMKMLPALLRRLVPEGVDSIIDFMPSGTSTEIYSIIHALAQFGSFVHMGGNMAVLPLPLLVTMVNCWQIVGTRNHSRADALEVMQWLRDGTVPGLEDLITHTFSLDKVDDAVACVRSRKEAAWMVCVNP